MTKSPDELLAMRFGGATVAENLKRAVDSGNLIQHDDGRLEVSLPRDGPPNWIRVPNGPAMHCGFLMHFAFRNVYARTAVPYGCRECYKVKVAPRTLRELVAAWQVGKRIESWSKWGIDFYNPYSQNLYGGYFYTAGLDGARALFKVVRNAFDAEPKIGADIPMTIKRGCSEYEAAVGPSDRYEFTPELAELEAYLKSKYRAGKPVDQLNVALAHWIDFAFRMGDNTYLDFTGGKRLRPATMTYEP